MAKRKSTKSAANLTLAPAQASALAGLERALTIVPFAYLWGGDGMGKTTVLRELHRKLGGVFLEAGDFVNAAADGPPNALEENFFRFLCGSLRENNPVIVDDVSMLDLAAHACGQYPRSNWWHTVFEAPVRLAQQLDHRLVLSSGGNIPHAFSSRAYGYSIKEFGPADYAVLLRAFLGTVGETLNAERIHRFAPRISAGKMQMACRWMAAVHGTFDTDQFIEYLRSQHLASNVNLDEVQAVDLHSLIGVDDVIRSLETYIVLPLENDRLASQLKLRAKRGVLLHGPPGTGKTTVGRALAHRLRGKFFLIDGTFIAGSDQFYNRVHEVFEAAKRNAPAVIFVDDADAIFQNNEEQGLYRYLLTMLDGLESESHSQVCVMLTAMNLGDLPPALVRSGRVELWLAMKLPDAAAREKILGVHVANLPPALADVSCSHLSAATGGLTGADLKRCVEDAIAIYAHAEVNGESRPAAADYFDEAIAAIRANKELYLQAHNTGRQS